MSTRHMFDFPNNDASVPLCHNLLTGGAVVRQIISNVDCEACIKLWKRAQDKPSLRDSIDALAHPTCQGNHEKMYLVCICCGEAFDSIQTAHEHGTADLSGSAGWCGDEGFNIVPESEAF